MNHHNCSIERLVGWICLAMSMALIFPNGSNFYAYLHAANATVPFLLAMFTVGTGLIYASSTAYYTLRSYLMAGSAAIWAFAFAVLYDNSLAYGPLSSIAFIMIIQSVIIFSDLRHLTKNS